MIPSRILNLTAILNLAALLWGGLALADPLYVEETKARIRSGPGTEYNILWEAPRYTPLESLAKYKDWYVVRDFQKDVGWVHEESVRKGKAAIVVQDKANIRKSPDLKSPIVFVVEKHYLFRVIETKGGWLKIKDTDGEEGWIHEKLVWASL
ncbi:MAG: SH3 domain-containing protein [Nitrospinota bacterium]|nr:SH3 domain-containing protein [Nitrospinota bacterium]MDH5677079.1 SH3 domain-containing protein [Nitrospinota bacterium]MDH5755279.1 SH3 domain-containing protein [Nitrospinota bacterium]